MKIKNLMPIERLIGKLDNDFNLSESDWIPRVAAWTFDALSQMKILPMEKKKRELEVSDRIAQFPCELNMTDLKVYDKNGCEIINGEDNNGCKCQGSTPNIQQQISIIDVNNKSGVNFMKTGTIITGINPNHKFFLRGRNIELTFETDKIYVVSYETKTYYDEVYDCEVPYIYDNGYLLEALAWYCMFKYLGRGSKHPVYNLASNNPATNPYIQWNTLRPKAIASVKNDIVKDKGWNNFFYNSTFLPRG